VMGKGLTEVGKLLNISRGVKFFFRLFPAKLRLSGDK